VCCFVCIFCTVTDFSAAEKDRGVKFCVRVGLLSGQVFFPFDEDWLAGSHGGGGISRAGRRHRVMSVSQLWPAATRRECFPTAVTVTRQWALGIGGGGVA